MYPSGCVPPSSYPLIKAHKPEKDFPVRNVVSHRGCPQEGLSSFLIPLLRPLLKDSPFDCKNSNNFVQKIKNIQVQENEILVSFDAAALFPSIPLKKCIKVIEDRLNADSSLSSRTPLTTNDLIDLINLCLSTSDFIYDNVHHTTDDSGPIGLSLMVPIAEIWMDTLSKKL